MKKEPITNQNKRKTWMIWKIVGLIIAPVGLLFALQALACILNFSGAYMKYCLDILAFLFYGLLVFLIGIIVWLVGRIWQWSNSEKSESRSWKVAGLINIAIGLLLIVAGLSVGIMLSIYGVIVWLIGRMWQWWNSQPKVQGIDIKDVDKMF